MTSSSKCKCREVIIFYSVQKKKSFFTYSVLSAPRVKKQLESISRKQLASRVVGITHTKNTTPRRRELRLLYLHTCIIWIFLPRAVNYFLTFFICPVSRLIMIYDYGKLHSKMSSGLKVSGSTKLNLLDDFVLSK